MLFTATPADGERALIDPTALDPPGATTLDGWQPTGGRLLAYQLSEGGTEESALRLMDVRPARSSTARSTAAVTRCGLAAGRSGFYYIRRLAPDAVPAGEEQYHRRVYLHRVGSPPTRTSSSSATARRRRTTTASGEQDGRWLVISAALGTAPRNDVWIADLPPRSAARRPAGHAAGRRRQTGPRRPGRAVLRAHRPGAPHGRLAITDPADPAFPDYASWQDLIPEDPDAVLTDFAILDGPGLDQPVLLAAGPGTRSASSTCTTWPSASSSGRSSCRASALSAA